MTAERLREAAALMRKRAEAATPGPWGWGGAGVGTHYWDGRDELPIAKTDWTAENGLTCEWMDRNRDNGEHIASWHPAVALAVADWLDGEALEMGARLKRVQRNVPEVVEVFTPHHALAVANAYLGGDQ